MQKLCDFFQLKKGVTALIGGGGKTSTMYALAEELRQYGSVVICTSTHILCPPQYRYLPRLGRPLICGEVVSTGVSDGRKLTLPQQSFDELCTYADYVLVEADGSRQLPLKAHAAHEPVIPDDANCVLTVIGIDGLGRTICEAAHRPERYAQLCATNIDAIVTPNMIQRVISTYPRSDGIIINKADNDELIAKAEFLAEMFDVPVAITAWQTSNPIKRLRRHMV